MAKRWIDERALALGVTHLRAPHDYTFWRGDEGEDFWATPPNYTDVVDLTQRPGGTFKLSALERKVIRKVEANIWNGHYMAAVGRFMTKLKEDYAWLPFQSEIANEYNTVSPRLTREQIRNICQRWHVRDATENIGIDQAGPPIDPNGNFIPYEPELNRGAWSPDDIRLHPHRSFHGDIKWWGIGQHIEQHFGQLTYPIYVDEPILLMPAAAYDALPPNDSWRFLGTKRMTRYGDMVEDLWSRGYYVCIHDGGADTGSRHGGGVSAGWVPGFDDEPGVVDDFIKELTGGGPPPPPPPDWTTVYEDADVRLQKKAVPE
jgi:hypothetical protein